MQNNIKKKLIIFSLITYIFNNYAFNLNTDLIPIELQLQIFTNIDGYESMKDIIKGILKLRLVNKRLNQNISEVIKIASKKYIAKNQNNKDKLYKEIINSVIEDENISELIINAFIMGGIKDKELDKLRDDKGDPLLVIAAFNANDAIINTLLKDGQVDPNIITEDKTSALSVASSEGYLPIVKDLLEAKANVNIQNFVGKTPLILAVEGNHFKVVQALLNAGADINVEDIMGYSALDFAKDQRMKKLIKKGKKKQSIKN